ncbi:hypothetical protein [Flammeovirga sp. SJP92]|uniref:hypothetical protein n=1 Tax=Flammeovirga sp. SJP92 TaxID=1775430 RepID=UPI0007870DFB|nr:hypothetical protein [Flammeovirga sp. SJP92]KXX66538.1 peptidylglycine monooxygenase [Flammeovirga sp. SJP92]
MNSRRQFIKNTSIAVLGGAMASPLYSFNILKKKPAPEIILGHGDYQYKLNKDWAQISSVRNPILNCHEMVMDSKGRLIMIGDNTDNNIMIFDKSGKLLDYWGTAYPGGHGLTLSKEGEEDFLYLTDSGWFLDKSGKWVHHNGRVSKTTLDGRVVFDIGHPQTVGAYEPGDLFCPTEVAIAPNGDIYVADGYGKDYILHYDAKGQFIRKWGGHKNKDKNYNLMNAHGVTLDLRDPNQPLLCCSSRSENMYKWFTLDGKFVKKLHLTNMYICRAVFDENNLYAGVCWSRPEDGSGHNWKKHTGFVTILEDDKVVSNPGGTAPTYKKGELQASYQLPTQPILHGHDVCVDEDKNLYICQWNAGHTAPLKLERV